MKAMYKIIILLLLVSPSMEAYSQRQICTKNIDAYVGIWEYKNNEEIFRIIMKKGIVYLSNVLTDCLLGDYYYKKGNIVVNDYNSGNNIPDTYTRKTSLNVIIYATNAFNCEYKDRVDENRLYMHFSDINLNKHTASGAIHLLSPNSIRWILEEEEGEYVGEAPPLGFSVPTDVIMTRVSEPY